MSSKPLLAALILLTATPALAAKTHAAGSSQAPTPVTTVEGISEYDLPNGLRVLLFPDASKATVTVNVTYFVGSRHEGYGETGMAHLLEHMVFKGTPTHKDIWKSLQDHGAMFNGSTSLDRTNYFEILPASADNLQYAIELEADRMVNSKIAAEDLAKEFSVVRNEFEMGENRPDRVLEERMFSSAYLWHNYGKSTIGSRIDIERVPADSLRAFYKTHYQPDNAMLVVAGKFDAATALKLIQSTFGAIPRPTRKLSATYTVEPVQDGERTVLLRRTGDLQLVGLMYHGVAGSSEDFVAEEALVDLLVNKPAGRLYKALVEKGMAASVNGEATATFDPGVLELFAEVNGANPLAPVRDKMIEVVESLAKTPITDDEVQRWKTHELKDFELAMTDSRRIGIELSESAALGDWRMIFIHRDRVKALTADRVRKLAASFLTPANRTVGLFYPTKSPVRAPLPDAVDVKALVAGYKGNESVAAGEVFVATIDNVEKRTTRTTLACGMKVAMLPKKTRGESVKIAVRLHFATEKDLQGKVVAASLVGPMLLRGTTKHTYQQLHDELDRLKADIRPSEGGAGAVGFVVSTVRSNLPAVIALVAEILEQPSFTPEQFAALKQEQLSQLEASLQEPQAQGFNTLQRKLNPFPKDNVRYIPTTVEKMALLKAAQLAEVAQIHKAFFGASFAELAVVGDFDAGEIKASLDKLFGSWKSPAAFARIDNKYQDVAGSDEVLRTPDKANAFVLASESLKLRDDDADYPALQLANYMFGGGAKSRVLDRLRQKEGLSYSAFSFISGDSFDQVGQFLVGAICAPQNAAKALASALDELDKLRKGGVSQAELNEAKSSYQLQFDNRLADDNFVAQTLARGLYTNRTLAFLQNLNTKVHGLSGSDIAAAVNKYLQPERLVKVEAGDIK